MVPRPFMQAMRSRVQTLFSPITSEKNDYLCTIIFWGGLGLKKWQSEASINEQNAHIQIFHILLLSCYLVGFHNKY